MMAMAIVIIISTIVKPAARANLAPPAPLCGVAVLGVVV
jgi:hypothetical protein